MSETTLVEAAIASDAEKIMSAGRMAMALVVQNARQAALNPPYQMPAVRDLIAWIKGGVEKATQRPVTCGEENHQMADLQPFEGPIFAQIEIEPGIHRVIRFYRGVVE